MCQLFISEPCKKSSALSVFSFGQKQIDRCFFLERYYRDQGLTVTVFTLKEVDIASSVVKKGSKPDNAVTKSDCGFLGPSKSALI